MHSPLGTPAGRFQRPDAHLDAQTARAAAASLEATLLRFCAESERFALELYWLLQAQVNSRSPHCPPTSRSFQEFEASAHLKTPH